jgi:predicted XRE-type DNA-binding protein
MGRVGNLSRDLHSKTTGSGVRAARIPKEDAGNKPKRPKVGTSASRKPLVSSGQKGEPDYQAFDSVWDALDFGPQEAANLEARSTLMIQLRSIIGKNGWTQAEAAKRCGVSQPRINDLLRGKIDKFSIDALVNMATALGRRVDFKLKAA